LAQRATPRFAMHLVLRHFSDPAPTTWRRPNTGFAGVTAVEPMKADDPAWLSLPPSMPVEFSGHDVGLN
jgi:hypothetical protein